MSVISKRPGVGILLAMLAVPAWSGLSAQELQPSDGAAEGEVLATVYGSLPADLSTLAAGPEIDGFISARRGRQMQITTPDGSATTVVVADATEIKATGGFLGLGRTQLDADSLLNGIPVTVKTVQWEDGLVASEVKFKKDDLETAAMIRGATAQKFAEQGAAIDSNTAAADALRSRMGDIDNYNIKGTTNVYFDSGKWNLSSRAEYELCEAAHQAEAMDNALLLVVGYTDTDGSQEYNQVLSERRASRVVNFLQQQCNWKPWRMLSPTGMSESDPLADNSTAAGKAQNRRVSVNILVSKATEEL